MFVQNLAYEPNLQLLKRTPEGIESVVEKDDSRRESDDKNVKIRCPKCRWSPRKHDTWACTCGHEWNTFDTGGVCPKCAVRWAETECLACAEWSLHLDWYEEISTDS